jgi:hypothetical protein
MAERRRPRSDVVLSAAAALISLCALITTFWQTKIMREQLRASVWPRVSLSHGYFLEPPERAFYRLSVTNAGVGPAIVKRVSVRYRGAEMHQMIHLLERLGEEHKIVLDWTTTAVDHVDILPEQVIPQQQTLTWLMVKNQAFAGAILQARKDNLLEVTIQYASVYGESWEVTYPGNGYRRTGWIDHE